MNRCPSASAVAFVLSAAVMWSISFGCASRNTAPDAQGRYLADVIAVQATGKPGDYTFSVAVSSPDSGCVRYADWWEVVQPDGTLVFRRVLGHSHIDEQPFTRSGGPVVVEADDEVIVRAHMNTDGYGGIAMRGTVTGGFAEDPSIRMTFANELDEVQPLPNGCQF